MKRLLAFVLSASFTLTMGCGYGSYQKRLQLTESRIQDEMTMDQVLSPPAQGEFEKLNIYLRAPKSLTKTDSFAPTRLAAGAFDVEASFMELAPEEGAEGTPQRQYSLHVLARREQEADPTQEQPEVEAPVFDRGPFLEDIRLLLSQLFGQGAAEAATETVSKPIWPRSDPPRPQSYERLQFNTPDDELVHVYLYHQEAGNTKYDVALIWVFPSGQAPATAGNPVDLTLGTFAAGTSASQRFRGGDDDFGGPGTGAPVIAF
ncbi:hypothetical protein BH23PLA1_BH23PLA1_01430 [soil metagenome]